MFSQVISLCLNDVDDFSINFTCVVYFFPRETFTFFFCVLIILYAYGFSFMNSDGIEGMHCLTQKRRQSIVVYGKLGAFQSLKTQTYLNLMKFLELF